MNHRKLLFSAIVIALLAITTLLFFQYNWHQLFTLNSLQEHANLLRLYTEKHYIKMVLLYFGISFILLLLPVPGDTLCNLTGGYLFGLFPGIIYINILMTSAGIVTFLTSRYLGRDMVKNKEYKVFKWIRQQIYKHGPCYFVVLRMIPLIPVTVVNVGAGLTSISLWTFIWTTSIGLIPVTFILAYAGQELRSITSVRDIFAPHIMITLLLLATIMLSPVLFGLINKVRNKIKK